MWSAVRTRHFGGTEDLGTVFQLTATGTLTPIYHFRTNDGVHPYAPVMQATDGSFYGTTVAGGPYDTGTVFKLDAAGVRTTLGTEYKPTAGLIQASDGSFYGTSAGGEGTVFRLDGAGNSFGRGRHGNRRQSARRARNR